MVLYDFDNFGYIYPFLLVLGHILAAPFLFLFYFPLTFRFRYEPKAFLYFTLTAFLLSTLCAVFWLGIFDAKRGIWTMLILFSSTGFCTGIIHFFILKLPVFMLFEIAFQTCQNHPYPSPLNNRRVDLGGPYPSWIYRKAPRPYYL